MLTKARVFLEGESAYFWNGMVLSLDGEMLVFCVEWFSPLMQMEEM